MSNIYLTNTLLLCIIIFMKDITFSESLNLEFKRLGWTNITAAEKMDIPVATVRDWTSGRTEPRDFYKKFIFEWLEHRGRHIDELVMLELAKLIGENQ